jgi:hypothetical protein
MVTGCHKVLFVYPDRQDKLEIGSRMKTGDSKTGKGTFNGIVTHIDHDPENRLVTLTLDLDGEIQFCTSVGTPYFVWRKV